MVCTLCNRFLVKAVDSLRLLRVVMKLITEVNAFYDKSYYLQYVLMGSPVLHIW